MGSHSWTEECGVCGYPEMEAYVVDSTYYGAGCPICGYCRWTDERIPTNEEIALAKQKLQGLSPGELERHIEAYHDNDIPLVAKVLEGGDAVKH